MRETGDFAYEIGLPYFVEHIGQMARRGGSSVRSPHVFTRTDARRRSDTKRLNRGIIDGWK